MPLDSDVSNADEKLHVQFYTYDKAPYEGRPFVRIIVPGDKTTVIDQPVRDDHKERFPRQWLYYSMQNASEDIPGVPLTDWRRDRPQDISEMQLNELQVLKFQVVEQVATATDMQLQRIGMGSLGLRNAAQMFLREHRANAASSETQALRNELAELKALLLAQAEPKNKGGRPRKELTEEA